MATVATDWRLLAILISPGIHMCTSPSPIAKFAKLVADLQPTAAAGPDATQQAHRTIRDPSDARSL